MQKLLFILVVVFFSLSVVVSPVLAQSAGESANPNPTGQAAQEQQRLANLKTKATKEIERRVTALNRLIERLDAIKRLSADQKTSLVSQVQTEINNLTAFKSKIQSDGDLQTLRADVKSIVTSYRIFVLFMPKINILAASDSILTTGEKLDTLALKLQTRIREAKTAGKDVTALQTSLAGMQGKIADSKTQAQNAQNAVLPLTPAGYPGNRTILQSARTMLQTGHQDLVAANQDGKNIIRGLKALGLPSDHKTATPPASRIPMGL